MTAHKQVQLLEALEGMVKTDIVKCTKCEKQYEIVLGKKPICKECVQAWKTHHAEINRHRTKINRSRKDSRGLQKILDRDGQIPRDTRVEFADDLKTFGICGVCHQIKDNTDKKRCSKCISKKQTAEPGRFARYDPATGKVTLE